MKEMDPNLRNKREIKILIKPAQAMVKSLKELHFCLIIDYGPDLM
jgi:hypothetical protein